MYFYSLEDAKKNYKLDLTMYLDDLGETLPNGKVGYWIGSYKGTALYLVTHNSYREYLNSTK